VPRDFEKKFSKRRREKARRRVEIHLPEWPRTFDREQFSSEGNTFESSARTPVEFVSDGAEEPRRSVEPHSEGVPELHGSSLRLFKNDMMKDFSRKGAV
jgi:hypothetical protein